MTSIGEMYRGSKSGSKWAVYRALGLGFLVVGCIAYYRMVLNDDIPWSILALMGVLLLSSRLYERKVLVKVKASCKCPLCKMGLFSIFSAAERSKKLNLDSAVVRFCPFCGYKFE